MSVQIRNLEKEDARRLALYANNKKIWDNVRDYFPYPYRLEHAQEFIEMANAHETNKIFAIAIEEGIIGVVSIQPFTDIYRYTAELGYWIGEPFWGKGYTSTAVNWITKFTWEHTEIIRIEAGVFPFNHGSIKVLEKCGYTREGIKKNFICKNDVIYDEHIYVMLKPQSPTHF